MDVSLDKDGVVLIVVATLLFLLLAIFIFSLLFLFQRRRQQHTLEIADMKNKYEAELLRSQLEIQEQTLRTISQEIHDNIGQVLSLAKLQLYGLKDNSSQQDIQPTTDLIGQAINDLRDLSKSLNPDRIADIGLMESIRHELQLLQKTNMMETVFDVRGAMQRLSPEKEIIVFRIFQELMNNTIRHSEATIMQVALEHAEGEIILSLQDNGKGFNVNGPKGIGLSSMQNRAAMIAATLQIESSSDNGTQVTLKVPAHPPPDGGI